MPPLQHADAIIKFVDAMVHGSKMKAALDTAPEGLFGDEYAATVATSRALTNDNLAALAKGVVHVLENEEQERSTGVQVSLLGPTSNELLQAQERERRRTAADAGDGAKGSKTKGKGRHPLRPTYRLIRDKRSGDVYAVRFSPAVEGVESQPTGLVIYKGYRPDDDRSLEAQTAELPRLQYDANPELIDMMAANASNFEEIPGMRWPVEEPAAAGEGAAEAEEPAGAVPS